MIQDFDLHYSGKRLNCSHRFKQEDHEFCKKVCEWDQRIF
jgi:hypothetical protein